jgi:hypothetical protein
MIGSFDCVGYPAARRDVRTWYRSETGPLPRVEPRRRLELREVAHPVEDLKTAAGDRLVCALAIADGDHTPPTRSAPASPRPSTGHRGVDPLTADVSRAGYRSFAGPGAPAALPTRTWHW